MGFAVWPLRGKSGDSLRGASTCLGGPGTLSMEEFVAHRSPLSFRRTQPPQKTQPKELTAPAQRFGSSAHHPTTVQRIGTARWGLGLGSGLTEIWTAARSFRGATCLNQNKPAFGGWFAISAP